MPDHAVHVAPTGCCPATEPMAHADRPRPLQRTAVVDAGEGVRVVVIDSGRRPTWRRISTGWTTTSPGGGRDLGGPLRRARHVRLRGAAHPGPRRRHRRQRRALPAAGAVVESDLAWSSGGDPARPAAPHHHVGRDHHAEGPPADRPGRRVRAAGRGGRPARRGRRERGAPRTSTLPLQPGHADLGQAPTRMSSRSAPSTGTTAGRLQQPRLADGLRARSARWSTPSRGGSTRTRSRADGHWRRTSPTAWSAGAVPRSRHPSWPGSSRPGRHDRASTFTAAWASFSRWPGQGGLVAGPLVLRPGAA